MIKVNNEIVEINRFPDGTLNIKGDVRLMNSNVIISWHYNNDAEFMAIAFLTKFYQAHGCEVILAMPYVPYARMDRVEYAGDIFMMKYFGEMINSLNFKEVWIDDPHSSVAVASMKNVHFCDNTEWIEYVVNSVIHMESGKYPIMFFPDEGAMKRYGKHFNGLDRAFAVKNRDWNTGKILDMHIIGISEEDIKGRPIIIRDDICSYGGTFYHAAKKLKEMGAGNIYLMVTHCENNIFKGAFGEHAVSLLGTGLILKVFTTDSIYTIPSSPVVDVSYGNLVPVEYEDEECCCPCCHCCNECGEEYDEPFENEEDEGCCETKVDPDLGCNSCNCEDCPDREE